MTWGALRLALAALVLHLALVHAPAPESLRQLALAPPYDLAAVLVMLILGRQWARWFLLPLLSLLAILKLADLAMLRVSGRVFDPWADLPLIDAALRLISGSLGAPAAIACGIAAAVLALALVVLLGWSTLVWARADARPVLVACGAILLVGGLRGDWSGSSYLMHRIELAGESRAELRELRQAAQQDPFRGRQGILAAIDRDLLVIFVESYGRSSFSAPFYADRHLATLRRAEDALSKAGLSMRSGFLRSSTRGGQSWLAHASFASGLRIGDQGAYAALLSSGRKNLFHFAQQAGFHTLAVMPGITRPWPEGRLLGFDQVLDAAALGYRGKPFDWVTMPDQFTLVAADRVLHASRDARRQFVQIALISSHAPWVPLARILPWDQIRDGTEFDAMTLGGDPPDVVWRDPRRVRESYRDALDYALEVVFGYALRRASDPPLIFVLGDHQAAPGIALDEGLDVPIHVIGPSDLVERSRGWGFAPGLVPGAATPALPIEAMRDLILGSFGAAGTRGPE